MDRSKCTTFKTYNTRIQKCSIQTIQVHLYCKLCIYCLHIHTAYQQLIDRLDDNQHIAYTCTYNRHCIHNGDSDLEAFNRNPAGGSIAVLAYRLATFPQCLN